MVISLGCVLMAWMPLAIAPSQDPNHVAKKTDANAVTQTAQSANTTTPASKAEPAKEQQGTDEKAFQWTDAVPWVISFALLVFALYQYWRRRSDAAIRKRIELKVEEDFRGVQSHQATQTAEEGYRSFLREHLGVTQVLGPVEIANIPVDLLETFVSLDISGTSELDADEDSVRRATAQQDLRALTPESVLQRAFANHRMLLILGDAGSGKTTLLKYYAMLCLKDERYRELGFENPPLPIYLPLGDVDFEDSAPCLLHDCLGKSAKKHCKDISPEVFRHWLDHRRTLILFDGLDEISDKGRRSRICGWIDDTARVLDKANFVVTSRWTGYSKLDLIQLGFSHLTAEIRDFSPEQQSQFLRKWFVAAYRKETRRDTAPQAEWEERQRQRGLSRAEAVIDFLALDQNKTVRELVAVPMLLQIVAIIWKEHENLPQSRAELYKTALNYLVYYREHHRHLMDPQHPDPPLQLDHALRVLRQVAFWMQNKKKAASDKAPKDALHAQMQRIIKTLRGKEALSAKAYCEYLRDRAAVLADYGEDCDMFRHKSFREYLAGVKLVEVCQDRKRLKQVAKHLSDDWWEEPLRFFMAEVDDKLFNDFMNAIFHSKVSKELDQKTHNLLLTLVAEASQRRIDSLVRCLRAKRLHDNQKRYVVDCLKTIGTSEALKAVEEFARTAQGAAAAVAQEIAAQRRAVVEPAIKASVLPPVFRELPQSFRNPYEVNAEYIRIPAGSFEYSLTKKSETVRDFYFARYSVTNQRYRRFVSYLGGREGGLNEVLPIGSFAKSLLATAAKEKEFEKCLGDDPGQWAEKLKSGYDEEKRFKGDDQPVVGVSWFDASAYCLWLTMLEAAAQGVAVEKLGRVYRLPSEMEWEWAAAGRAPGGGLREYPWPVEKGEPNDKLANYRGNVGATTPVGRYPDGATPEGLMDMAGNVWEWMENWHEKYIDRARSLRGGSWNSYVGLLRCSARCYVIPGNRSHCVGFRVVCSQLS